MPCKNRFLIVLLIILFTLPRYAHAAGDFEAGDGWSFQDGTLIVTENWGLKDFLQNDVLEETGDWKYNHSVSEVDTLVIGRNVTELVNEIYDLNQIIPSRTSIEAENACFVIDGGWVVNTKTNTLYGAADVPAKQSLPIINDIPAYIEHIGDNALCYYAQLCAITIPPNVVSIGENAFGSCINLDELILPAGLQTIGVQAFHNCPKLKKLHLGSEIREVGSVAFSGCIDIEQIDIREARLKTICSDIFGANYKLTTIELPETVERIESLAFRICYSLESIIIQSDQVAIEGLAFSSCDNLQKIIFTKGTPASIDAALFGEKGAAPDGKGYISDSSNQRDEIIPYPTLYYTADYAAEWAPNGETEWNGYPIQQISQAELDIFLAQARGEAAPEAASTDSASWWIAVAAIAVLALGVVVCVARRRKKKIQR